MLAANIVAWWSDRRPPMMGDVAYGDVPLIHEEMRRAANTMPGGGAGNTARALGHDIAHREGGF